MLKRKFRRFASLATESLLYGQMNREDVRVHIDQSLTEEAFHYEVPTLLCQPYDCITVSEKQWGEGEQASVVRVYHHQLDFRTSTCALALGVVTSAPIGACETINFTHFQGTEAVHETVAVVPAQAQSILKKEDFNSLLKFNQLLQAEWFKVALKNVAKHEVSLDDFFGECAFDSANMRRTYLFTISALGEIDWNRMEHFVAERLGFIQAPRLSQEFQACADSRDFRGFLSSAVFTSSVHKQCYTVYHVIDNVWQRQVGEYFQLIMSFCGDEWTFEKVLEYYGYSYEEFQAIEHESIGHFLYELPFKVRIESLFHLRNAFEKQRGDKGGDLNSPLAMALPTKHLKSLQMFRTEQFRHIAEQDSGKSFESSIRSRPRLKKPQLTLLPIHQLGVLQFDLEEMDKLAQLPMVMLDIERQVVAQELGLLLGLPSIPLDSLLKATQTPGFSTNENYEVLETVGDSVLKFLASFTVFFHFGHYKSEDFLTAKRTEFISNKLLGLVLFENSLDRFVKVHFYNYCDWHSPVLANVFSQESSVFAQPKVKLTTFVLADIFEALLGACFMATTSFQEPFEFLRRTQHPLTVESKPFSRDKFLHTSIRVPLDLQHPMFRNPDTTFRQLCASFAQVPEETSRSLAASISQFLVDKKGDDYFFLNYLQDKVLHYRFQRVQLLIEALTIKAFSSVGEFAETEIFRILSPEVFQEKQFIGCNTYEKLEFLGDAVLEALVVTNAYLGFQDLGLNATPDLMHKVKMTLLGNSFMARQSVALGLHHFLLLADPMPEIDEFLKLVDFDVPFRDFVGNVIAVPKVLSDLWEAICGAVLMDGGWQAVLTTFGQLYRPFLQFVCRFILDIQEHVIQRVQHYCTAHFKIYEFRMVDPTSCQIFGDGVVHAEATGENEKVAKEKACRHFCAKFSL